jgi:hypothetical protein
MTAAARELGLALPAGPEPGDEPGPSLPDLPAIANLRDVPELARLWDTALDSGTKPVN